MTGPEILSTCWTPGGSMSWTVRRYPVPGGWMYESRFWGPLPGTTLGGWHVIGMAFVPDPSAPEPP